MTNYHVHHDFGMSGERLVFQDAGQKLDYTPNEGTDAAFPEIKTETNKSIVEHTTAAKSAEVAEGLLKSPTEIVKALNKEVKSPSELDKMAKDFNLKLDFSEDVPADLKFDKHVLSLAMQIDGQIKDKMPQYVDKAADVLKWFLKGAYKEEVIKKNIAMIFSVVMADKCLTSVEEYFKKTYPGIKDLNNLSGVKFRITNESGQIVPSFSGKEKELGDLNMVELKKSEKPEAQGAIKQTEVQNEAPDPDVEKKVEALKKSSFFGFIGSMFGLDEKKDYVVGQNEEGKDDVRKMDGWHAVIKNHHELSWLLLPIAAILIPKMFGNFLDKIKKYLPDSVNELLDKTKEIDEENGKEKEFPKAAENPDGLLLDKDFKFEKNFNLDEKGYKSMTVTVPEGLEISLGSAGMETRKEIKHDEKEVTGKISKLTEGVWTFEVNDENKIMIIPEGTVMTKDVKLKLVKKGEQTAAKPAVVDAKQSVPDTTQKAGAQ